LRAYYLRLGGWLVEKLAGNLKHYDVPFSDRRTVSITPLRRWEGCYWAAGFDALKPSTILPEISGLATPAVLKYN
jgi:hypothetical protein